jgi:predicted ferric reductase
MGLGFVALAIMGGHFLLTARFRRATAPFGIDVIYIFHRWLAVIGVLLVVGHWLILRARYPASLGPAWPGSAAAHMTAGRVALLLFTVILVTSLWRRRLRHEYDHWRIGHTAMAVVGFALSVRHVRGVAHYSGVIWNGLLFDLALATIVAIVAYVRVVKPMLLLQRPWTVEEVRAEGPEVWTLSLRPKGHPGLRFEPGQFAWLSLGVAPWRAKEHPFSFAGSAERSDALEFTIKGLGNFTRTVGATEPGTVAYVDGPHGSFSPDRHPGATGFVLVSGGVGVAPMMCILRTLADRADPRPVWLVCGHRDEPGILFRDEIETLKGRLDLHVFHVLRDPSPGWNGVIGVPDAALMARVAGEAPAGSHVFLCGPVPLTDMAQRELRRGGIPLRRIHVELFSM